MVKAPVRSQIINLTDLDFVAVKVPVFSFTRLRGADPMLGVEMRSTGEVACFGSSKYEALLKSMLAAGLKLVNKRALLSVGPFNAKVLRNVLCCLHCLYIQSHASGLGPLWW